MTIWLVAAVLWAITLWGLWTVWRTPQPPADDSDVSPDHACVFCGRPTPPLRLGDVRVCDHCRPILQRWVQAGAASGRQGFDSRPPQA